MLFWHNLPVHTQVTFLAAFAVGFVSFLSPCVLPLLPGYLSMLSGVAVSDLPEGRPVRLLPAVLFFVFGFTSIFVLLGLAASGVNQLLFEYRAPLRLAGGLLVCLLGCLFVASAYKPSLAREFRPLSRFAGKGGPLLTGTAFALAWTPCIGPTLAAVLTVASLSPASGFWLLAAYSLGLALPFVIAALAFTASRGFFAFFARHRKSVNFISGGLLIVMGLLVASGGLTSLNLLAERVFSLLGIDFVYRL